MGYSDDSIRLSFTGTYVGKSYEDDQFITSINPDLDSKDISIPAQFYLDTQLAFTPIEGFEFYVGVDNLLDNDAPNVLTNTPFNTTGSDTASDVYDIFERRLCAGVRLRI